MSDAQQIFMAIGILASIIFIFCLFIYILFKLNIFLIKLSINKRTITDEKLTLRYNDMKVNKDNKRQLIIVSIITGVFCGGLIGGIFYYFFIKKMFRDTYEVYKQAMIERNLPL